MAKDNDQRQQRLDGSTAGDENDDDEEEKLDDFGEHLSYWKTKGGYRKSVIKSLLQKSVRRSCVEEAMWASWELARSGETWGSFGRMTLFLLEDIAAGEPVALKLQHLEQVAVEAGIESEVGQIAAVKAAKMCAEAWSSRESVHLDDYLRHVAVLQADVEDPKYTFPAEPGGYGYELDDRPQSSGSQMKFGDGDLELEDEGPTNDNGEPLREFETHGGFHYAAVLDILDEAVEDKDWELAGFSAWELTRSGYHSAFWDRINELGILYSSYDSHIPALIDRYETLATEKWSPSEWEGRIAAIHAVFTILRGDKEYTANSTVRTYSDLAEQRADGEAEFPAEVDELSIGGKYDVAKDKHTREGKYSGRGWKHFWLRAARVGPQGEPERSKEWQRRRMDMTRTHFRRKFTHATDEEIEHAVSPVSADEPWEEDRVAPDAELDDFDLDEETG